ncbi:MAG: hypothetical protein ACREK1_08050 [Longimicrobiales bacterium]
MRRRNSRIAVLVLLCVLPAACSARSDSSRTARGDVNVITTAEMDGSGHADALSLVQSLRPQWLRVRGTTSVAVREVVRVYLDGSLLGDPDYLAQISTQSISSLRYMDGLEATQRWGLDHGAGAILVTTLGRSRVRSDCCG